MKDHQLGKQSASGGPNLIWKIYEAKNKTTNENVSLFVKDFFLLNLILIFVFFFLLKVFDRKTIEKLPKNTQKMIWETLKRDVYFLLFNVLKIKLVCKNREQILLV